MHIDIQVHPVIAFQQFVHVVHLCGIWFLIRFFVAIDMRRLTLESADHVRRV